MTTTEPSRKAFRNMPPPGLTDPLADELTQPYWNAMKRQQLVGPQCANCGTFLCVLCSIRGVLYCQACAAQLGLTPGVSPGAPPAPTGKGTCPAPRRPTSPR